MRSALFQPLILRVTQPVIPTVARSAALVLFAIPLLLTSTAHATDDCQVETSPGVFVSCMELLDRANAPKKKKPKEKQQELKSEATRKKLAPTSSVDIGSNQNKEAAFAADLTGDETARLRETTINWDPKKASNVDDSQENSAFGNSLTGMVTAQEDKTPLGQERLRIERLNKRLEDLETSHERWHEARLADLRAQVELAEKTLADVERIALGEMQSCRYHRGLRTVVKTHRMTAGGPVRLNDAEVRSQAAGADDPVCARNTLVTQTQVDEVREMHKLKDELDRAKYGYWQRTKLRATQDRIAHLKKKHFGVHRAKRTLRDLKELPDAKRADDDVRFRAGGGQNPMRPLNAKD